MRGIGRIWLGIRTFEFLEFVIQGVIEIFVKVNYRNKKNGETKQWVAGLPKVRNALKFRTQNI